MNTRSDAIRMLFCALLVVAFAPWGFAQVSTDEQPKQLPGAIEPEAPLTAEKAPAPPVIGSTPEPQTTTPPTVVTGVTAPVPRQIEQRVDNTNYSQPIRPVPKTRKNVMRLDNQKKPKTRPIAIIKGSLGPWGYTERYLAGQISQPKLNNNQPPGAPGQPNAFGRQQAQGGFGAAVQQQRGAGGGGSRRNRDRD